MLEAARRSPKACHGYLGFNVASHGCETNLIFHGAVEFQIGEQLRLQILSVVLLPRTTAVNLV